LLQRVFLGPGGWPDDVRAYHFPGVSLQPFLTPDDAQAIDKYLAHITTIRSDIVTKPWLIDDMVILGLQHGVEFLTILELLPSPFTPMQRETSYAAQAPRTSTAKALSVKS